MSHVGTAQPAPVKNPTQNQTIISSNIDLRRHFEFLPIVQVKSGHCENGHARPAKFAMVAAVRGRTVLK